MNKAMLTQCVLIISMTLAGASPTLEKVYTKWPFNAKEAVKRQKETAKTLGVRDHVELDLGDKTPLELVLIPAGKFMMGSPDTETISLPSPNSHRSNESPLHEVTITRPFFMSKYLITQKQYQEIMGTNPSKFAGKSNPVDAVTWAEAALFCSRASEKTTHTVRLPTEAEWEYAARAGTASRYSFGDDEKQIPDYSWFHDNAHGMTHPVGQKLPNAWRLFDVHGLLWEYTSDFYADSYTNASIIDPQGPASGTLHAVRSGTWGSRSPFVRSAIRIESPGPDADQNVLSHFGFRVVVDVATHNSR